MRTPVGDAAVHVWWDTLERQRGKEGCRRAWGDGSEWMQRRRVKSQELGRELDAMVAAGGAAAVMRHGWLQIVCRYVCMYVDVAIFILILAGKPG